MSTLKCTPLGIALCNTFFTAVAKLKFSLKRAEQRLCTVVRVTLVGSNKSIWKREERERNLDSERGRGKLGEEEREKGGNDGEAETGRERDSERDVEIHREMERSTER